MATTYTLKFPQFNTLNQYDDGTNPIMNDVIRTVHWIMEAETDGSPQYKATSYGTATLPYPTYGTFIARGSVTVSNVQTWFTALTAEEGGGSLLDTIKAGLDAQIAKQQAPTDYSDNPDNTFTDGVSV